MIEIIPNWHPLLVHFTVGLLTTSVLFYLASAILSLTNSWKQQWLNMANWSLWSGCLFAIATAVAGWLAYNSVAHDRASHAAMTLHRNWALPTASIFLLLGLWAIVIAKKDRRPGFLFLTFSTIAAGLLMVTGWLGAEAVYRYGLGVKSLPVVTEGADGHNHSHGTEPTVGESEHQHGTTESEKPLQQDGHQHEHKTNLSPGVIEGADGHNHSHGTEPTVGESEHQHGTTESEKPLQQDGHQHEHKTNLSPGVIEGADGHNHSHGTEPTVGESEHQHGTTESEKPLQQDGHQHEHKTMTDNYTKPIVQLSDTNMHTHDLNVIEPIAKPLDQGNTSEKISITPSELHLLQHTETHSHKH